MKCRISSTEVGLWHIFFLWCESLARESAELRKLIEPAVAAMGFELVGVEFLRGKTGLLRVYIDHEDGVGVDDCKSVS